MADRLYLSYWLRGFTETNMLRHFGTVLKRFPFSKLAPEVMLRVYAQELKEPAVAERHFKEPIDWNEVIAAARQFGSTDTAFELVGRWDIWQFEQDWHLKPAEVSIFCFAPGFDPDFEEDIRIDFGVDIHFLPQPEYPEGVRMVQSNVQSLLQLVHDLDDALTLERRLLQAESGENFAERLQEALREMEQG